MSNKDRWSSLSMKDRAGLIKLYVNNGITDISTIKNHYNKFDEGGEKTTTTIPKGNPLKDLAYLIGSDSRVSSKGYATFEDLKRIFNKEYSSDNPLEDNKLLYIYGNIMGLYPSENSNGKDYSNYLRKTYPLKTILGKIKEYEGTINPYNEYVVDERDRGLIEELVKRGKGIYSNADTEYSYMADMYDENMPYRDDVSGYHAQFVNTPNGPAISASDLYDFGPDYSPNKYVGDTKIIDKLLGKAEALALGFVGNPYVLRQDNIPIRFINMNDDEYGEEWQRAQGFKEGIERGMLSEADKKAGITIDEKLAGILGYGYIEPSVVEADRKANGGKLNLFEDGGSKESRATLMGTVPFNPFKSFNRHYRGTNIYEADSFNDAFRQARIDEQERFVYNGEVYSTDLAPNPFVEAAKNWDTEGDLAKEDFRMSIIRNPQGVLEYYNTTYPSSKYTTANKRINSYDIPYMYSLGTKGMEDLVMNRYANHSIGDAIWKELGNSNLSYEQKLAVLANSYHETNGWTALRQYGNGPASGIYMMEDDERNSYNNWLNENRLTDSYANQTKYVISLFDNESPSLKTAWDRAGSKQEEIRGYKDANEANKKGYRSAYNHLDYTTKQAFKDWKSNDLDATTKAFEGLFERAGVPALENRMRIAHILSKKYK